MTLIALEHQHPGIACILYASLWAGVSVAILWPFSRDKLLNRLPVILTIVTILLVAALEALPNALPQAFSSMVGHSIYTPVTTRQSTGTVLTTPWVEIWQETVGGIFIWIAVAGGVWGLVNVCRGRAWIINSFAILYVLLAWFFGHAYIM